MGEAALNLAVVANRIEASWPMRRAQQAFALLIEDSRRLSGFRVGARRASARSALSELSVDDRGPFERWLALQLLTAPAGTADGSFGVLATVDASLATAVRVRVPSLALELGRFAPTPHAAAA